MFAIRRTVLSVVKNYISILSLILTFGCCLGVQSVKAADTDIVETTEPIFVYLSTMIVGEWDSPSAAFSAIAAVASSSTTLPGGIVVTVTVSNLHPWRPDYYPTYNGRTSYYVSSKEHCYDGSCSFSPDGGPSVQMSIRCPEDVTRIGTAEYRWQLITKTGSNSLVREVSCQRRIPLTPPKNDCGGVGNPILPATGEKIQVETDYKSPDGVLEFTRTYRSIGGQTNTMLSSVLIDNSMPRNSIKPSCYSSWYTENTPEKKRVPICVPFQPSGEINNYMVRLSTGRVLIFGGVSTAIVGKGGIADKLVKYVNQAGFTEWELTRPDNTKEIFDATGKQIATILNSGRKRFYEYSTATTPTSIAPKEGLLISIADENGRKLNFFYNSSSQLTKMLDPNGGAYLYGFDIFNNLTSVVYPDGTSRQYKYGEASNINGGTSCGSYSLNTLARLLTGIVDEKGVRYADFKYGCDQKAISTEHIGGVEKFSLAYPSTTTTTVTTALGSATTYNYTTILNTKNLTGLSQPAGSGCAASTKASTYDVSGLLKTQTDFKGNKTQFAYEVGRALETVRVEGVASTDSVDYLPQGKVLSASAKKITTQWHSQHRKPVKKAEPKLLTTFIYNGDADPFNSNQIANCSSSSQPFLCHKVQQATTDVNGAAGLTAVVDSTIAKREEFYTYNGYGQQLTYSRTGVGTPDEIREYYDITTSDWTKGDLKSITNALGHKTEFTRYDPNGRLLAMQDANGVQTLFTYDARGRLTSQSVAGAVTNHTYDLNGNRIGSVLPNGVTINYEYDAAKRLIAVVNALGDKINYEYDVESNLRFERFTNASGANTYTKQHVYDALSRVKNTLNSNSQGSTYLYDANGNLTSEVDAKTQTTSNTFDPLDRLTRTTDALTGKTDYSYDAQGNLTQVKDPKGNATVYNYNAFGDLVSQVSPDTGTTTFTYDAAGNRTSSTDARGVVMNYSYDALNRLTGIQYPAAASENITYSYDATVNGNYGVGRLTSIVTGATRLDFEYNPQGLITKKYAQAGNTFASTQYRYDAAGNLTGVTYPSGREVNYQLDTTGKVNSISTKLNANASAQNVVSNISYLPFGPAQSYSYGNGLQHAQTYDLDYRLTGIQVGGILNRSYGYDLVNNITSINNGLQTANSQTYSYDALNRLISAAGGYGTLGYSYDAVGNRLTETRNGVSDTYSYQTTSNRLTGITRATGNRSFTYDAAGNPTQRTAADNSNQTFNFNNANRLSSVNVNGALAATYTYNPLGQRVVKTLANGSKEIYHYDEAGQLIAVTDAAGTTVREYIYWGSQQIALVNNGTLYFIHSDHLNTPQVVTNASQQVVWMGDYEPFGKLAQNQSNSIELYSRFPGQYLDGETGLYYNYFRDYDSSIGRYIESDPIGLEGGINTYGYVGGNPLSFVDQFGLSAGRLLDRFPIPFLPLPNPNHSPNPGYGDPTVPYDPTDPMPNTPHDDSDDSASGKNCPVDEPEFKEDCFTVQQDCYDDLGGYYVLSKLSAPEQERLLRECVKARAPHCL